MNLRSTLQDLRPLVRETRPAARPLTEALQRVRPLVARARPVVSKLRETVRRPGASNDLLDALRGVLPVAREGVPAFESTSQLLNDLKQVVTELRPYTPDLVNALGAFSGTSSGYYDANGHYLRISFQGSLFTLSDTGRAGPAAGAEQPDRAPPRDHAALPGRGDPAAARQVQPLLRRRGRLRSGAHAALGGAAPMRRLLVVVLMAAGIGVVVVGMGAAGETPAARARSGSTRSSTALRR